MSFKRKVNRTRDKVIDPDIAELLSLIMQKYRLTELRIYKMPSGYGLTCIPDKAELPCDFAEAYEVTAAYMNHNRIKEISCTSNDNDFEIRIKK